MIETIGPAVCGTRTRTAVALAWFAAGTLVVATLLGIVLGLAGSSALVPLAVALALVGALREAGIVRLPLPQRRRQVPERWHHALPLPVWASGYGAMLGAGVLTYQPVATLPVVAAAAAASGPLVAALALAAFGLGRVLGAAAPASVIDGMAGLYRPMRRLNAAALVLLAVVLVAPPA